MIRFLTLLLFISIAVLPSVAETGKYDALLHQSASWSCEKIVSNADSLLGKGREDEAMVLYMVVASRTLESMSEKEVRCHVKANLSAGDIHYGKGNYSNALKYYVSALKMSEQSAGRPYLAVIYKNMGNVYNMFQDYDKGKRLYLTGLEEARKVGDQTTAYKLLQNLVGVSINLDDVASARKYFDESQATKHPVDAESRYMDSYTQALILRHEGKLRESIDKFKELARESRSKGLDARYECSAYGEIGRIYDEEGRTDSAMFYLSRCKDVAQAYGILYQFTESLKLLYSLCDSVGLYDMARQLKDRYLSLKDSIYNQRQFEIARNQQFLYEMEKTERKISELNEQQARSARLISRQRVVLFGILGAVVLALLLLYYFYRQKKKLSESYRNLYEIHQRAIADQRDYREKQKELTRANEEMRLRLEALSGENAEPTPEMEKTDDEPASCDAKYERSALSRFQSDRLADAISNVMDTDRPFCSPDFSLNSLAALVGSNTKYVSQVINDTFKKNFSTFVNEYRVNLACERLADEAGFGNYSLNGIAESVGFKSSATFTTVFKKITGITPSVYQKLTREKRKKEAKHGNAE